MNRRNLLVSVAALPFLQLSLPSSCSQVQQQLPTWLAGLQAVATEAAQIVPELTAVGLNGSALATVETAVSAIQKAVSALNAASTTLQGASVLVTIENYINVIAPVVVPFVAAVPGGATIALIVAALPAIEVAVNFGVSLLSPTALGLSTSAPAVPITTGTVKSAVSGTPVASSQDYLNLLIQRAKK